VPALVERGHEVRALVRPDREAGNLEALGARVDRGDVTDPVAVEAAARGAEAIVHLAVPPRVSTLRQHRAVTAANAALRPFGRQAPFTKTLHFFTHPRSFDISKARRVLGYRPLVALEEGVGRTLGWYREKGYVSL
jgi:nucleoside-diphosphate-sugar epimerase